MAKQKHMSCTSSRNRSIFCLFFTARQRYPPIIVCDAAEPGPLPPAIPVFIAQGTDDRLVQPKVTISYMDTLCRGGSKVALDLMKGVGHAFIARDAARSAVEWMGSQFSGAAPPDDCGHF